MSSLSRIVSKVKEMMKMNSQEELLPKWYADTTPKSKVTENLLAITLLILLGFFTLGIFSGLQHTSEALKGRK